MWEVLYSKVQLSTVDECRLNNSWYCNAGDKQVLWCNMFFPSTLGQQSYILKLVHWKPATKEVWAAMSSPLERAQRQLLPNTGYVVISCPFYPKPVPFRCDFSEAVKGWACLCSHWNKFFLFHATNMEDEGKDICPTSAYFLPQRPCGGSYT